MKTHRKRLRQPVYPFSSTNRGEITFIKIRQAPIINFPFHVLELKEELRHWSIVMLWRHIYQPNHSDSYAIFCLSFFFVLVHFTEQKSFQLLNMTPIGNVSGRLLYTRFAIIREIYLFEEGDVLCVWRCQKRPAEQSTGPLVRTFVAVWWSLLLAQLSHYSMLWTAHDITLIHCEGWEFYVFHVRWTL